LRHSYSMPRLPSALRAMKACRPPCESTSKTLGLGPRIFPNFAEAIRAYAIFAVPRDASFRLEFSDRNRTGDPLLGRQLLYH
jgi:hypothetical protein